MNCTRNCENNYLAKWFTLLLQSYWGPHLLLSHVAVCIVSLCFILLASEVHNRIVQILFLMEVSREEPFTNNYCSWRLPTFWSLLCPMYVLSRLLPSVLEMNFQNRTTLLVIRFEMYDAENTINDKDAAVV